jgi:ADP-heptose:LPS heptosyltransferase
VSLDPAADGPRMLALLFQRVGDSLLAIPALRAIKKHRAEIRISVIAERQVSRVFAHNPWIDEVVAVEARPSTLKLAAAMRQFGRPDVTLDFLSDPRSAAACLLSGSRQRIGFARFGRRWAYTDPVPPQDPDHLVYSALHKLGLAAALGALDTDVATEFYLTDLDRRFAATAWSERNWNDSTPVAALFVHSRREYKRWPIPRFAELIRMLRREDLCVPLVLLTPGDETAVNELRGLASLADCSVIRLTDLGQLGAVLERCRLLIGCDGGPRHIAIALGVPTVGVFGSESPVYWTPPGSPQHAVVTPTAELPTGSRRFTVESVSAEQVFATASRVMKGELAR